MSAWLAPPQRGLGLGLRLGLLTTLVVTGVMAVFTSVQLKAELTSELRQRQAQLGESVAPLTAALQSARTRDEASSLVDKFHASYVALGHVNHRLSIVESSGRVFYGTPAARGRAPRSLLTSGAEFIVPPLGSEPVTLVVAEDDSAFLASRVQRWRAWLVHIGVTALLTLVILFIVIRFEVTRPLDRLVTGVGTMERGYWEGMPDPGGAWEIRWLGWRFHALGQELSRTVEHLVAAQQRAYAMDRGLQIDVESGAVGVPLPASRSSDNRDSEATVRWLQIDLHRLLRGDAADPSIRALAQTTWDHRALLADRLGEPDLCTSLENAALRVLVPDGFNVIEARINTERPQLECVAAAHAVEIRRALAVRCVPVADMCHRVKHAAAIWKKMRHKNLEFGQVHDLVALRIVVATEADCYHAFGVIHDLYTPIVGRFKDYIAVPKCNGYRGLHTSVRDRSGSAFEVQIRSIAMHRYAERGSASHAVYKEAAKVSARRAGGLWKGILGGRRGK